MPRNRIEDLAATYDIQVEWKPTDYSDGHYRKSVVGNGYVQLGVTTNSGASLAQMLTGENETPADFEGIWGTLGPAEINRLIKTLQRAKKQAYPSRPEGLLRRLRNLVRPRNGRVYQNDL